MNGEHFETFVNQGDNVKTGEKLLSFDIEKIQAAGYSLVTPIVIANTDDYLDIIPSGLENPKEFLTIVR
ncbi:MAG: PTS glucose transporter subunit IIA [Eubacteriales bacterium]|nr:PTS glucose transporter subunit IIA [Eubacteriales bacterium]